MWLRAPPPLPLSPICLFGPPPPGPPCGTAWALNRWAAWFRPSPDGCDHPPPSPLPAEWPCPSTAPVWNRIRVQGLGSPHMLSKLIRGGGGGRTRTHSTQPYIHLLTKESSRTYVKTLVTVRTPSNRILTTKWQA